MSGCRLIYTAVGDNANIPWTKVDVPTTSTTKIYSLQKTLSFVLFRKEISCRQGQLSELEAVAREVHILNCLKKHKYRKYFVELEDIWYHTFKKGSADYAQVESISIVTRGCLPTLRRLIQKRSLLKNTPKGPAETTLVPWLCGALEDLYCGVMVLSSMKVLHRDIKPANAVVDCDTGRCKLIDFGAATNFDLVSMHTVSVVGTPGYIAPELLLPTSSNMHSGHSDIWSVGWVMVDLIDSSLAQTEKSPLTDVTRFPIHQKKRYINRVASLVGTTKEEVIKFRKQYPSCPRLSIESNGDGNAVTLLLKMFEKKVTNHDKAARELVERVRTLVSFVPAQRILPPDVWDGDMDADLPQQKFDMPLSLQRALGGIPNGSQSGTAPDAKKAAESTMPTYYNEFIETAFEALKNPNP